MNQKTRSKDCSSPDWTQPVDAPSGLVAELLAHAPCAEQPAAPAVGGGIVVGEVLRASNAALPGRALVAWSEGAGASREAWVPLAMGVAVRAGDRVLLAVPAAGGEATVFAVVSGASARPVAATAETGQIVLRRGEALRVVTSDGRTLLDVLDGDGGPVLRLADGDLGIVAPGRLRISAASVEIAATAGEARMSATDDVVVTGENIRLN